MNQIPEIIPDMFQEICRVIQKGTGNIPGIAKMRRENRSPVHPIHNHSIRPLASNVTPVVYKMLTDGNHSPAAFPDRPSPDPTSGNAGHQRNG